MTPRPKNIGAVFDWHAAQKRQTVVYLDRPMDITPHDTSVRYDGAALANLVAEVSGWLYAAGVRRGDRIAVVKENHFDMIMLVAAAARIGAVAAAISGGNLPEHLAPLLERVSPKLTVFSRSVLERAAQVHPHLLEVPNSLVLAPAGVEKLHPDHLTVDDLRGSTVPVANLAADDEPMFITHTSGTTGVPKLVVHSARSNYYGSRLELNRLPMVVNRHTDVSLVSISFAHSRSQAWIGAQFKWAPAKLVAVGSHSPDVVERMFEQHRPTTVESTPAVYQRWQTLVESKPELFASVRLYVNTFDLMHPSTVRAFLAASRRRFPLWAQCWGQSEVGPIAGTIYTRAMVRKVGSAATNTIGWSVPGLMRTKVVDPDTGRRVRWGRKGVLLSCSESRCIDYLGETDRHAFKQAGKWWNTGDMGYKDSLGRIHFVDRAVDEIPGMSGTELESILLDRLTGVSEVVVLGVKGQDPIPVLCYDECEFDKVQWAAVVSDLPRMAEPVVVSWDDLPRTSTWKIRRAQLRQRLVGAEHGHGVAKWT
ncbi:class I adenylate-forming enzyme family protein [Nocardia tengchongensis]|uniref:class I adenylate-forming enzyme family protein n=1 Tax=Nocardia tengchongensis TaxID=2055889 RepID=UPI00360A2AA1